MAANAHVFRGPTIRGMLDEAEAKGRARGMARILVLRLKLWDIPISDEQLQRITTCTDEHLIEEWFDRAVTATTADEIFTD